MWRGALCVSALVSYNCFGETLPQSGDTSHISTKEQKLMHHTSSQTHTHTHKIDQRKEDDVKPCRPIHNLSLRRSLYIAPAKLLTA